ncbi:hypothetical protein [Sodalis sp. RH22]|uniref:hypothetical protein n=1 Tax=unclassified Sodalis (in: enterobacteria) TaxID=2636512 RepID=UPI0039B5B6E0
MRLLITNTGLVNPLLPVYNPSDAELSVAALNPAVWAIGTASYIKNGLLQKVSALANRVNGSLFNAVTGLEPVTASNAAGVIGINFSGANGLIGDTAVIQDANINSYAFLIKLPSGALSSSPSQRVVIATSDASFMGVGINTTGSGSYPVIFRAGTTNQLAFTGLNMGTTAQFAVVIISVNVTTSTCRAIWKTATGTGNQTAVSQALVAYQTSNKFNIGAGLADGSSSVFASIIAEALFFPGLYLGGTTAETTVLNYLYAKVAGLS